METKLIKIISLTLKGVGWGPEVLIDARWMQASSADLKEEEWMTYFSLGSQGTAMAVQSNCSPLDCKLFNPFGFAEMQSVPGYTQRNTCDFFLLSLNVPLCNIC